MGGSGRGEDDEYSDNEEEEEEEAPEEEGAAPNPSLYDDPNWPEVAKEKKAFNKGWAKERIFFDRAPTSYECLKGTAIQNNNFRNDFIHNIKSNHPLIGLCASEPEHPYGKKERTLVFITMLSTAFCIASLPVADEDRMGINIALAPFLAIAEGMMKHMSQCGPCQNPDSCWYKCKGCCEKLGCLGLACMIPTQFIGTLAGGIALTMAAGESSVVGAITAFIASRFTGWATAIFPVGMYSFRGKCKKEKKKWTKNTGAYLEFMKNKYQAGDKKSEKKKTKLEKKPMWDAANDIPVNHFVRRKGDTSSAVPPPMLNGGSKV